MFFMETLLHDHKVGAVVTATTLIPNDEYLTGTVADDKPVPMRRTLTMAAPDKREAGIFQSTPFWPFRVIADNRRISRGIRSIPIQFRNALLWIRKPELSESKFIVRQSACHSRLRL